MVATQVELDGSLEGLHDVGVSWEWVFKTIITNWEIVAVRLVIPPWLWMCLSVSTNHELPGRSLNGWLSPSVVNLPSGQSLLMAMDCTFPCYCWLLFVADEQLTTPVDENQQCLLFLLAIGEREMRNNHSNGVSSHSCFFGSHEHRKARTAWDLSSWNS